MLARDWGMRGDALPRNRPQARRFWTAAVQNASRDGNAVSRFRGAKREFVPGILTGLGTFATVVDLGLRSSDSVGKGEAEATPSPLSQ